MKQKSKWLLQELMKYIKGDVLCKMKNGCFAPFAETKRIKIRENTVLLNFPLFCPKCRQEQLINVQQLKVTIIKEPDAQTQSR